MLRLVRTVLKALVSACSSRRDLALENLALRQQLAVLVGTGRRPRLSNTDRSFWVLLSRAWNRWAEALVFVQPATVFAWHPRGFQAYWTRKSRRRCPGRPSISREVRRLIVRMAHANATWGAPRVHGELQKLGIGVSQATVSKYMPRRRKPPSQTWRTFLENHVRELVSVDFLTAWLLFHPSGRRPIIVMQPAENR